MDDLKKDARHAETDVKEAWRKVDGESVGDKAADARDRTSDAMKDAGDDIHRGVDDASRDAAYERGRADEGMRENQP